MANFEHCRIDENVYNAKVTWNSGQYNAGDYLPCINGLPLVPGEACFVAPAVLGQTNESLVALRYQDFIRRICRLEATLHKDPVRGLEYCWDSMKGWHWFNPDERVNHLLNLACLGEVKTEEKVGEFMEGAEGAAIPLPLSLWNVLREVDLELFRRMARPGDLYDGGELKKYQEAFQKIPAVLAEASQDAFQYTWDISKEALLPLRRRLLQEALSPSGDSTSSVAQEVPWDFLFARANARCEREVLFYEEVGWNNAPEFYNPLIERKDAGVGCFLGWWKGGRKRYNTKEEIPNEDKASALASWLPMTFHWDM